VSSSGSGPSRIKVGLRPGLAEGTYTVSWHASSADTHAVSGSFRFSVGHDSVVRGTVPGGDTNDLADAMLGALRWTGYLGLVLGPGLLLVAVALWPAGLAERRTRRLTLAGLSLLAVSTLGTMLLQGVWASGQPISALWTAPATLTRIRAGSTRSMPFAHSCCSSSPWRWWWLCRGRCGFLRAHDACCWGLQHGPRTRQRRCRPEDGSAADTKRVPVTGR
jgi:hypothetical protein